MPDDNYDFEFALALLKEKNCEDLWRYALPYAKSGNSNAQCMIGMLHQCGLGVPADLDEAERWLCKAAEQNNPVAWNNLGSLSLARGEKEQAKRCYQKAVE